MNRYERRVAYILGCITLVRKKPLNKNKHSIKAKIINNTRYYFLPKENYLKSAENDVSLKYLGKPQFF